MPTSERFPGSQSATERPAPPRLELVEASKRFGGTTALAGVDLALHAGEILGLVGENGAGKSTVIKLLAGVHGPDQGAVHSDGKRVVFDDPADARGLGVATIFQEPALFPALDVAENVFIGRPPTARLSRVDWRAMRARTEEVLERLGVELRTDRPVGGLSLADQQLVEISRALSLDSRVLIMDEPTASLSGPEVERLFGVIRRLRGAGVAVLFVSHRLEEVTSLTDRVSVLRDGRVVLTSPSAELSIEEMVRGMVGRELSSFFSKADVEPGRTVLEVDGLSRAGAFTDVSFAIRAGEILGMAGLVGAGRTEVARTLFGIDEPTAGQVKLDGSRRVFRGPRDAIAAGLVYVPEDRPKHGLIFEFDIEANETLPLLRRLGRFGLRDRRRESKLAAASLSRFEIRASGVRQLASTLSGGNQQKVVLAKWLQTDPRVLVLDEPTQGIDVATKAAVHRLISELASKGMAVLLISSELPEVIAMSDRVVVVSRGRITARFERGEADQERVMHAATGAVG